MTGLRQICGWGSLVAVFCAAHAQGCTTSDVDPGDDSGGATSMTGDSGGSGGDTDAGGAGGAAGMPAGVAGAAGAAAAVCATPIVGTVGAEFGSDFETPNQVSSNGEPANDPRGANYSSPDGWTFGFWEFHNTGTLTFEIQDDANSGTSAIRYLLAPSPGGSRLGIWAGCIDASAFDGMRFFAKGTVGVEYSFAVITERTATVANGGTCTAPCIENAATFEVEADWAEVMIPWDQFVGGQPLGPLQNDRIAGFFIVVPLADSAELFLDDFGFIPNPEAAAAAGAAGM